MWALLVLALFLGILAGTFTGLAPGIHINLVAAFLISLAVPPVEFFIVFVVAMSVAHTFIDFIPSIFLGAPDEETGLSTLPGHELLLEGKGYYAVKLTATGSIIAITSLIFLIPFFIFTIPLIYPFLNKMMGFLLIWISIFLIATEENRLKSLLIFALAGFLGFAALNIASLSSPLLPLLTGLFGASTVIYSIKSKTKIPKQKIEKNSIPKKELIKPTIATMIVSPICAVFPGLGSNQAAIIGSKIPGKLNREQFLILLGAVNTLMLSLSFVVLYILQKNRSGVAAAISSITKVDFSNLILIIITIFLSTIFVVPLTFFLTKLFAKYICKINYSKLSCFILIFITIVVFIFSGFIGILVYTISTIVGILAIEMTVRKGLLMGSLIIPTIFYYLPI